MNRKFNIMWNFLEHPTNENLQKVEQSSLYSIIIEQMAELENLVTDEIEVYNRMFKIIEEYRAMKVSGIETIFNIEDLTFLISIDDLSLKNLLDYCYVMREVCNNINNLKLTNSNYDTELEYLDKINKKLHDQLEEYYKLYNNESNTEVFLIFAVSILIKNFKDNMLPSDFRFNKFHNKIIAIQSLTNEFEIVDIERFSIDDEVYQGILNTRDGFGTRAPNNRLVVKELQPLYLLTDEILRHYQHNV